jgi:hypothetical protein
LKLKKKWLAEYLPKQGGTHFVSNRFLGERFGFPWNEDILVCDVFFVGKFKNPNSLACTALLNSTMSFLSAEVLARKTYGIGVAYLYGPEINSVDILEPNLIRDDLKKETEKIFNTMRKRNLLKIEEDFLQPDRRALDNIVFDILGLTQGERDATYEAVVELVRTRLDRARSV